MRTVLVIGIGAGHPDQITVEAVTALNRADVVLVLDKGAASRQLVELRAEVCRRHLRERPYRIVEVPDPRRPRVSDGRPLAEYEAQVRRWHELRAEALEQTLLTEVADDGCAAFLVVGDPSLYDSTIRVVTSILERGRVAFEWEGVAGVTSRVVTSVLDRGRVAFEWEVVAGVTSLAALTAAHRIPLNGIGEAVAITTGRRFTADPSVPEGAVAVMLDDGLACQAVTDPGVWIHWGANLGTPQQELRSGPLVEVVGEIAATRARLRAETGWVLDTYVLTRR